MLYYIDDHSQQKWAINFLQGPLEDGKTNKMDSVLLNINYLKIKSSQNQWFWLTWVIVIKLLQCGAGREKNSNIT